MTRPERSDSIPTGPGQSIDGQRAPSRRESSGVSQRPGDDPRARVGAPPTTEVPPGASAARQDLFCTECGVPLTQQEGGRCSRCFAEDLARGVLMTQPDKSDIFNRRQELRDGHRTRVELCPRPNVVDVTPFCGPEAEGVMVNFYTREGTYFWSPAEALAIAKAIEKAAHLTANPPEK